MTHGHPLSTAILLADAGASTNDLSNEREPLLGSMFILINELFKNIATYTQYIRHELHKI